MRNKKSHGVSVLLCCGLTWAPTVLAQVQNNPNAGETSETTGDAAAPRTAVDWGHAGLRHFSEKRWNDAIVAFGKAEALAHSPVFLLYAARAFREDNRLLDAHRLYRQCIGETLTESSPLPWEKAVREAHGELLKLEEELSGAKLAFSDNWRPPLSVHLPNGRVTTRRSSMEVVLLPGKHVIEVEDESGRKARQIWLARAGEHQVRIQFSPNREVPNTEVSVGTHPSDEWASETTQRLSATRRGAVVVWSLGGAALVGAGVASGFAISRTVELKNRCGDNECDKEDEYLKYQALKNAHLATAGLVVAGVAGAVGLTLWLIPPSEVDSETLQAEFNVRGFELNGRF